MKSSKSSKRIVGIQTKRILPSKMNTTADKMATPAAPKVRMPKKWSPEKCKKLTFTKKVVYTSELTFDEFMEEDYYAGADYGVTGRKLTADEKKDLWLKLCRESANGDFEDDDYEEEDDDGEWTESFRDDTIQGTCDEMFKGTFTIQHEKMVLVCPDGTEKALTATDKEGEHYAEWKDIGVFYYPKDAGRHWVQGQMPTYTKFEDLTEDIKVEVK